MKPSRNLFPNCVLQLVLVMIAFLAPMSAQKITTSAGGFVGDGGPATSAGLDYPRFVIQDRAGNTYFSDSFNHRIRKVNSSGIITTFAGTGIAGFSGDGGLARNAMLSFPTGILFDSAGNMLVADGGNNRIRKIDPVGMISTIAGSGNRGYSGDGGPAINADLNDPWGLSLDASDNLFFSDVLNSVIRRIDTAGTITTVAGNGTEGYNGDGIPAVSAELNLPRSVLVDSIGNLFIADTGNHRVRQVDTSGIITTFAGNGQQGFSGDGGNANDAKVGSPRSVLIRGNQLFISNGGAARIRVVNLRTNIIDSFAGSTFGYDGDGSPPLSTEFNGPTGMLFTSSGNLLVADQFNARIREVSPNSTSTKAGGFEGDSKRATSAVLTAPENFAFDSGDNYFIAEWGGNRIRKVDGGSGQITTAAGTGITGYSGDGGPATDAQLNEPFGVTADKSGNLYIADTGNNVIRKVDASGTITTFASDINFFDLLSLATDNTGNLYVADDGACAVFKITPAGSVSVVAGNFTCGFNGDGIRATDAELNAPYGVAVDSRGNIYVGDTLNNRIRKVDHAGIISTIAGTGECGFSGDGGAAISAAICNPENLTVDIRGNVYFGDYLNLRVRKVTRNGKINTIAGSGNAGYNGENLPAVSTNVDGPIAVGIDTLGSVFILDDVQARVRKIH